jgi:hypothetical protein
MSVDFALDPPPGPIEYTPGFDDDSPSAIEEARRMAGHFLLLVLATTVQAGSAEATWKPFTSATGGYTVLHPAKPTERKQMLSLPGRKKVDLSLVAVKRSTSSYSVASGDLDAVPDDAKAILDAARDDDVKSLKGKVNDEKSSDQGGVSARELKIEVPKSYMAGGALGRARISLIDRKLYLVVAVQSTTDAQKTPRAVEDFFASFKSTVKPAAAKVAAKFEGLRPNLAGPVDSLVKKNGAALPGWQERSSAVGRYSVLLPGKPMETSQKVNVPLMGEVELHLCAVNNGAVETYAVMYNNYPLIGNAAVDIEKIYDGARQGAVVSSGGGTLAGDRKIMLGDLPGREIKIELPASKIPGGGLMQLRYFLKGARLYQVMHIAPKGELKDDAVEKFLDSFRITGN